MNDLLSRKSSGVATTDRSSYTRFSEHANDLFEVGVGNSGYLFVGVDDLVRWCFRYCLTESGARKRISPVRSSYIHS